MADGKWIRGLHSDLDVVDAARIVLKARVEAVRRYLPLAAKKAFEDSEYVHQTRVATRRIGAAVELFREYLQEKRHRKIRKQFKQIRRIAGAARDWDVFQEIVSQWALARPKREQPGVEFLLGVGFSKREDAQVELAKLVTAAPSVAEVVDSLQRSEPSPRTLGCLAVPALKECIANLESSIAADQGQYEHLHRIRIAGKRLRYAMEICVECFDSRLREFVYPAIEELQEILGSANDSHVIVQWLTPLIKRSSQLPDFTRRRVRPGISRFLTEQRRILVRQRRAYAGWSKKWRTLRATLVDMQLAPPPEDSRS
jgi:CHAD domain-containing protein